MRELEAYQSAIVVEEEPDSNGDTAQVAHLLKRAASVSEGSAETNKAQEQLAKHIRNKKCQLAITVDPAWSATVEEMLHLSSYQITLKPLPIEMSESSPSSDASPSLLTQHDIHDVRITFEPQGGGGDKKSTLLTVGEIMTWKLPVQVQEYSYSKLTDDCISIRLKCTEVDDFLIATPPVTPRIQQMHCKSCQCPLLSNPIERVVPLPSGYWDEISDYLICYPGQPAVHFGSTTNTVPIDLIWEDPSVWVVHPDLVADTVQPLAAVDLYATQPFLGGGGATNESSWRPQQLLSQRQQQQQQQQQDDSDDILAIEQLCCSYCCFPLGLATHEGYYLYQHRLMGLVQEPELQQQQRQSMTNSSNLITTSRESVSIFVAQELKRHAESQAIFTFVVTCDDANRKKDETHLDRLSQSTTATSTTGPHSSVGGRPLVTCLLLHVVSWDSILLHASASAQITPKRVVKVIYEVSSTMPSTVTMDDGKDPDFSSWTWGGMDLCCDPLTETPLWNETDMLSISKKKLKSVHLTLDPDEWEELVLSITQCPYSFPQEVVDATIRVKLGMSADSTNAGMAAMDLY